MKNGDKFEDYQQLKAFINSIPGGVGIYNLYEDGKVQMVYLNDGYYELIGAARSQREQFSGFSALEAVPSPYREKLNTVAKSAFDGENSFQVRIPNHSSDGKERWLQLNGKVVQRNEKYCVAYITYTDVTEFERNSQALARANAEIQIAANAGGILYWVYDIKNHRTTITNGRGYGYDKVIENVPEVFRGTGSIHKDDEDKFFELFNIMQNGASTCDCYARIFNQIIGEYQWQHVMFNKYSDDEYIGSSIEVTEQKRAEQRFEDELALKKDLLKDCILFYQLNLTKNIIEDKITKYAEFEEKKAPYTVTDTLWNNDKGVIIDDEALTILSNHFSIGALLNAWNQGKTFITIPSYQIRLSNGIRMVETSASIMKKPTTGDIIAFSYTKDVTDREIDKWISAKLLNEQYEAINIIDCRSRKYSLYSFSYNRSIVASQKALMYIDGLNMFSEKYVEESDKEYYKRKADISEIQKVLDAFGKYSFSFHIRCDSEEKPVKKMTYFYLDSRHHAILSVLEDVTEVSRKEKENVDRLHAALEKAELATKAKSEFLSRMSHDMRTPMNGILGMAELSQDENDISILKSNIRKIKDSGDYLLGLINDTLDFQRIESGKLILQSEIVDARSVIQGIIDIIRPAAEKKHIDFRVENVNADLQWFVRIDPLRIKQIFINLLSNAVKFTPEGGTIEFIFKLLRREDMISHDCIIIRDTGIGMSEEFIKNKLFKPFSQEKNEVTGQYAGSGLGLSIVKSLVELMGGHIEVESELGAGTAFTVYLDFERINSDEAKKAALFNESQKEQSFKKLKGKKILLAEDHPLNAEITGKLLQRVGCEITWAKDGRECTEQFQKSKEAYYDAILMDIRMPNMDGLEATRALRKLCRSDAKSIPIIAMTANAFAEDVQTAIDAGMNAHISKPVEPSVMYQTLTKFIK